MTGILTDIHKIFWAAFTQCISWCVFGNFAFTGGRTPRASSGSVRARGDDRRADGAVTASHNTCAGPTR